MFGNFDKIQAITLEELEKHKEDLEYINDKIISVEEIFKGNDKINLTENEIDKFLNGVKITTNLGDRSIQNL